MQSCGCTRDINNIKCGIKVQVLNVKETCGNVSIDRTDGLWAGLEVCSHGYSRKIYNMKYGIGKRGSFKHSYTPGSHVFPSLNGRERCWSPYCTNWEPIV